MDNWLINRFINAIRHGKLETVRELINSYGLPYLQSWSKGYHVLCYALDNKHSEIAKLLLTSGSEVNIYQNGSYTPLHFAVKNGDIEIINMLLVRGANINAQTSCGETPLHKAFKNNDQVEIIELLLKHEADVNVEDIIGKTPLFYAIEKENLKISKLLLDNGANVKDYPELLNIAVKGGCTEIVELLLQHNADVNVREKKSLETPLHKSARSKNVEICEMLLNKGVDVDAVDCDGFTALHIATQEGYQEIMETLLKSGADINSRDAVGKTALHIASYEGHNEVVTTLLEYGCDINSRDKLGYTALHIATQWGQNEVVTTLLEYGSDINIMTYNDLTPLYYAKTVETIEILERHIVQMKTANLYVSQQNLLSVDEISYRNFQEKCENEITSMKSEKMNNYNISFYDILTKNTDSLAICLRNENIVQILKLDDYKTKLPIYGSMIKNRFRNGMKRKELLDQGNQILHFLFANHLQLPQECTEKICSYLSDEDLKIIIEKSKDK